MGMATVKPISDQLKELMEIQNSNAAMTDDLNKKLIMLHAYQKFVFNTQNERGMATTEQIFEWFYSEIEARDKEIDALNDDVRGYRNGHELNSKRYIEALSKLQRLEEIIKAADGFVRQYELCDLSQVELCIEHYNKLKSKLPSGI